MAQPLVCNLGNTEFQILAQENPAEEDGKPMFGSLVGEAGETLAISGGADKGMHDKSRLRLSRSSPDS